MFTVGMNSYANSFFAITTMAVGIPTGIKIFNWLGTMWGGKIQFKTPMLFCIAFLFQFLIAGLTGIMMASAPFDWQLSLSYFVVAHFHYVIVGGILFALFGAFYYWYPKITGRMMSEGLGKIHFWLFVLGFHMTFDVMHIPGLLGMPRRIYTYEPGRGWDTLNLIVSIGAFIQAAAILVFVANLVISYWKGAEAGNDPWGRLDARMVRQLTAACYNFASIPTVASRRPLWDLKHPEDRTAATSEGGCDECYRDPGVRDNSLEAAVTWEKVGMATLIIGESAISRFSLWLICSTSARA
jgi:cytochrome c oxidase subunit 1